MLPDLEIERDALPEWLPLVKAALDEAPRLVDANVFAPLALDELAFSPALSRLPLAGGLPDDFPLPLPEIVDLALAGAADLK